MYTKESGMFNVVSQCAYGFTPDPVKQHDVKTAYEERLKADNIISTHYFIFLK